MQQYKNNVKSKAVEAYKILNDVLGDLVIGTNTIDHLFQPLLSSQMDKSYKVGVTRLCVFHLIITLNKYIEFYQRYKNIIPKETLNFCKELAKILKDKQIPKFRNKVIGHIWDKDKNTPITDQENDMYLQKIYGGDFNAFLLWINNPNDNFFPKTVVSIVENTKKKIAENYKVNDSDIFDR
jgi:hypothetical protein